MSIMAYLEEKAARLFAATISIVADPVDGPSKNELKRQRAAAKAKPATVITETRQQRRARERKDKKGSTRDKN